MRSIIATSSPCLTFVLFAPLFDHLLSAVIPQMLVTQMLVIQMLVKQILAKQILVKQMLVK